MKNTLLFTFTLLLLTFSNTLLAQNSLNSIIIQSSELPPGWGTPYSNYSVSFLASNFFENYESTYASQLNAKLIEKTFQSFAGPTKGTVFYMLFDASADMTKIESFAKNLIWEGTSSTSIHPELIFTKGDILIIISVPNPQMASQLELIIKSK